MDGIDFSILVDNVARATDKNDSMIPDSLGDKLFRTYLKLIWARRNNALSGELIQTAKNLINLSDCKIA